MGSTWSSSVKRVVGIQRDLADLLLADLVGTKVSVVVLARGLKSKCCSCRPNHKITSPCVTSAVRHDSALAQMSACWWVGAMGL